MISGNSILTEYPALDVRGAFLGQDTISLEGDSMDMKTIDLLEDIIVLMSFNTITSREKAVYKARIKELLNELA